MEESVITSVKNPRIKHVVALQMKSALRREEGLFVVEGQREIEHCIACGYEIVELFYLTGEQELCKVSSAAYEVSPVVYGRMAYRSGTEGVIAIARSKSHRLEDLQLKENPLVVVLESVEKPGNLGAILRTAEAANVDAVIVCDPQCDLYNPNIIRASVGAFFSVPTVACTSEQCIKWLKANGIRILTAQLQNSSFYYETDMVHPTAIVMGTEATGLTDQWRQAADEHIKIPMLGIGDSLNVSVSAAILMFEAVRQRNFPVILLKI